MWFAFCVLLLYMGLAAWWIQRSAFFDFANVPRRYWFGVLGLKLVVGILYGILFSRTVETDFVSDTVWFVESSRSIATTFFSYPKYYLYSILGWAVETPADAQVFEYPTRALWWKNLGTYSIMHLHACLYVFTGGYYLLNLFFIALWNLIGVVWFYKAFRPISRASDAVLLAAIVGIPSVLFWTSGVHKEAYLFLGLAALTYSLSQKKLFLFVFGILLLLLMRHFLVFFVGLGLLVFFLAKTFVGYKRLGAIFGLHLLLAVGVLCFGHNLAGINIFEILSLRQAEFIAEQEHPELVVYNFAPTAWGVVEFLPIALKNGFLRPYFWRASGVLQLLSAAELLCMLLGTLGLLVRYGQRLRIQPLHWFLLGFSVNYTLLIGFMVTNPGTIVRYRLFLFLTIALIIIDLIPFSGLKCAWFKRLCTKNSRKNHIDLVFLIALSLFLF